MYVCMYGCVRSSFLCEGFPQPRQAGATPHHGARASHHRGPSRRGAQAPDAQAQQSWPTGPAAPRHAGSSQTRARTRAPCIGRQIPNHWATREAQPQLLSLIIHKHFLLFPYTHLKVSATRTDQKLNLLKNILYQKSFSKGLSQTLRIVETTRARLTAPL